MEGEKLKKWIGANIAAYRKRAGWTQAEMAQRLNYSDKAVSKWERGDSVPDVITLATLAKHFGVTVNDLLADPATLPEEPWAQREPAAPRANRNVIAGLSTLLVCFVSLLCYEILSFSHVPNSWLAFVYAVPVDAIVLLSLRSAWKDYRWNRLYISLIIWGVLLCVALTAWTASRLNLWKVLLLGIPGQAAVLLWFHIFPKDRKGKEDHEQEPASESDS